MGMPPIKPDFKKLMVKIGDHELGSPGLEDFIMKEMSKTIAANIDRTLLENGFEPGDEDNFEVGQPEADFETGSITVPIAIRTPVEKFVITLGVPEDMPPIKRAVCLHGTLEELRKKLGEKP